MKDFTNDLKQIPKSSGIYIYRNIDNIIIYVGKAVNLFNRVRSYFNRNNDIKTRALLKKIHLIEYIITNSEVEALLLENNLIKEHQPKYNIKLKDAKSYPLLKITKENLPRIVMCREKYNKNDEYFGPFIDIGKLRTTVKFFKTHLKLRTCYKKFKPPYNYTVCLNYHIKKCSGPCAGKISEEDYLKTIDDARKILSGKVGAVTKKLNELMLLYSNGQNYEKAASIRDQIISLEQLENDQLMDNSKDLNSDYVGLYSDYNTAAISIIKTRQGKVIDKENYMIDKFINLNTLLNDFLVTYYLNLTSFPKKIFVNEEVSDKDVLIQAIDTKFKKKVSILKPVQIFDKKLLKLSIQNAEIYFEEKQYKLEKIHNLRELKKVLNLPKLPRVIECFDVATLNGKFNTAALVSFKDGKPNKTEYRQFNVEGEGVPNDYAMMEEVIGRRYQKLKIEKLPFPDLIIVDGGKGQVTSAMKSLDILGLSIPVIGIAKKHEFIFTPHSTKPIILPQSSIALKLIQAVRDESHRFSNTRLSKRYKNDTLKSELSKIEGVGEKRLNLLLKKFKSLKNLKGATVNEIAETETIGQETAEKIWMWLKK